MEQKCRCLKLIFFYWLFDCSFPKAGAKHSQVFLDTRDTKVDCRKITGYKQVSYREIGFLLGTFFPILLPGLLFDLCIQLFTVVHSYHFL